MLYLLTEVFSLIATSSLLLPTLGLCSGLTVVLLQSMGSAGLTLPSVAAFPTVADKSGFLARVWCPFRMVMDLDWSGNGIDIGMGTGVMGFGIDSLVMTLVSETKEFITGPGMALTKVSLTLT